MLDSSNMKEHMYNILDNCSKRNSTDGYMPSLLSNHPGIHLQPYEFYCDGDGGDAGCYRGGGDADRGDADRHNNFHRTQSPMPEAQQLILLLVSSFYLTSFLPGKKNRIYAKNSWRRRVIILPFFLIV